MTTNADTRPKPARFGPILCFGFAATVAMWIIWFITHHPAWDVPPFTVGILLIFTLLATCIFAGGAVDRRSSWLVGLGAGVLAAVLNLVVLGSYLTDPSASQTGTPRPSAAAEAGGFLLISGFIGLVGGLLGTLLERIFSAKRRELIVPVDGDWLSRFTVVATAAAFPLLVLGGLVTSSGSALSVPDWPGTYGANMFLYPIGLMTRPRIFIEHSHRLFGVLVGLTTITLVIYTVIAGERRRWVICWVVALLALVIVQGVIGGVRVNDKSTGLALVHGVLAQLFFAGLVAYAAFQSPTYKNADLPRNVVTSRRSKLMATAFLHTTILQLIFGAMYRHMGSPHAMYSHIAFSMFVLIFAIFAAMEVKYMLRDLPDARWARPQRHMRVLSIAIHACVGFQFILGWATLAVVGMKKAGQQLPVGEAAVAAGEKSLAQQLVPTIHQANGALLLALATLAFVWVRRFRTRQRSAAPAAPTSP